MTNLDPSYTPLLTAIPFRGTKDEAVNAYHPQINMEDPQGLRFDGSFPDVPFQRWVAVILSEEETDLLLRITAMIREDEEVSDESRAMAGRMNTLVQACITDFVTYEQREKENLSSSSSTTS